MKDPLTPAGIEPATFRIVAQHLNHCATAVPIRNTASVRTNAAITIITKLQSLPMMMMMMIIIIPEFVSLVFESAVLRYNPHYTDQSVSSVGKMYGLTFWRRNYFF